MTDATDAVITIGGLPPDQLKALSSLLKRIAKVADSANNFAARVDPTWSSRAFEAQTFIRKLQEEFDLTRDEVMFVEAIQTCVSTVLMRFRVHNLHREELELPTPEKWTKSVLQALLLSDLRRVGVAYELRTADGKVGGHTTDGRKQQCSTGFFAWFFTHFLLVAHEFGENLLEV